MGEEISEILTAKNNRRWWQKKRWWVIAFLLVLVICIHNIPRFPFGLNIFIGQVKNEILVKGMPLSYWGKTEGGPTAREIRFIRASENRFPNFDTCTKNDTSLNWPDIIFLDDYLVCAFRASAKFRDPEKIASFLTSGDASSSFIVQPKTRNLMQHYGADRDGIGIGLAYAFTPQSANSFGFLGIIKSILFPRVLFGRVAFSIALDDEGNPLNVEGSFTYK